MVNRFAVHTNRFLIFPIAKSVVAQSGWRYQNWLLSRYTCVAQNELYLLIFCATDSRSLRSFARRAASRSHSCINADELFTPSWMETIIVLFEIALNFNDWTSYRRWCCQFIDHSSILLNFNDEIIFDWIRAGRSIVIQTPEMNLSDFNIWSETKYDLPLFTCWPNRVRYFVYLCRCYSSALKSERLRRFSIRMLLNPVRTFWNTSE